MANTQGLIDWGISNASKLNLHVTRVEWIDDWLPGYFDYEVKIKFKNMECVGRGIDASEPQAFAKGLAEALERLALSFCENPWCAAAYYDFEGAAQRAYRELLGIDRVLCHHFCRRKFRALPPQALGFLPAQTNLFELLGKYSLDLGFYELKPGADSKVCAAFMWSKNKNCSIPGFVAGFGCDTDIESAGLHAFLECARSAVAVFIGGAMPPKEELIQRPGNPRWHFWQAQSAASMRYIEENLLSSLDEEKRFETENISIKDVAFMEINTLNSIFPDIPLVFVQASSARLIKPQFGEFKGDAATMRRLEIFNGGPVRVDASVPHFYG